LKRGEKSKCNRRDCNELSSLDDSATLDSYRVCTVDIVAKIVFPFFLVTHP